MSFPFDGFNGLPLKFGVIRVLVMIRLKPWCLFSNFLYIESLTKNFKRLAKLVKYTLKKHIYPRFPNLFAEKTMFTMMKSFLKDNKVSVLTQGHMK